MLPFDQFIKLYTGIPCDFDNRYGTQCMDLMHFYVFLCLGIYDKTMLAAPAAKNVWYNFDSKPTWKANFTKIKNVWGDLTNFPQKGDIIFWDGYYGHVAICITADGNDITSFDANYPVGTYPHKQYHNYYNVLGWLRPKVKIL